MDAAQLNKQILTDFYFAGKLFIRILNIVGISVNYGFSFFSKKKSELRFVSLNIFEQNNLLTQSL